MALRFYRGDGVLLVEAPRRGREDSFAVSVAGGFQAVVRHPGGNRRKRLLDERERNLNGFEFCDLTLRGSRQSRPWSTKSVPRRGGRRRGFVLAGIPRVAVRHFQKRSSPFVKYPVQFNQK